MLCSTRLCAYSSLTCLTVPRSQACDETHSKQAQPWIDGHTHPPQYHCRVPGLHGGEYRRTGLVEAGPVTFRNVRSVRRDDYGGVFLCHAHVRGAIVRPRQADARHSGRIESMYYSCPQCLVGTKSVVPPRCPVPGTGTIEDEVRTESHDRSHKLLSRRSRPNHAGSSTHSPGFRTVLWIRVRPVACLPFVLLCRTSELSEMQRGWMACEMRSPPI